MAETKKNDESELGIYIIGIVSVLLILVLWCYTYIELRDLPYDQRSSLGDMFGTVNALFSGLAFAGIIFTILLQRKELSFQRKELRETRAEFVIQNKNLKIQRFENTFFNLLELHNQIVNDMDYKKQIGDRINSDQTRTVKGRAVFKDRFKKFNAKIKQESDINKLYLDFFEQRKAAFGHYLRNLYQIFKMIHETEFISASELNIDISNEDNKHKYDLCNYIQRYRYTSIVRAQLSDYELLLLFYNCLSDNGVEKFKPLVEEYAILKNLPQKDVKQKKLLDLFKSSAYKNKHDGESCV